MAKKLKSLKINLNPYRSAFKGLTDKQFEKLQRIVQGNHEKYIWAILWFGVFHYSEEYKIQDREANWYSVGWSAPMKSKNLKKYDVLHNAEA